jgi:arylformamidase
VQIIDLSMTIQPHWRWKVETELASDFSKGDPFRSTVLKMIAHAFTHVDTPLHIMPDQTTIDSVALELLSGQAAVVDLTFVEAKQGIRRDHVKDAESLIEPGDILLLKTGWDLKRSYTSKEFWTEAPFVEEETAEWLATKPIKAIGFDFPQDFMIRETHIRHPATEEMPTHDLLLRKGIFLIEYLCNLHSVQRTRVNIFALPLKIAGAEAAPARVIAAY